MEFYVEKYINVIFINSSKEELIILIGGFKMKKKHSGRKYPLGAFHPEDKRELKDLENLLRISPKEDFENLCSGCTLCESFCHTVHYDGEGKSKSAIRISGANFPIPGGYRCVVCNQCGKCAKECPTDAIVKDGNIYKINKDLCVGCTAPGTDNPICVEACPTGAIYIHKDQIEPIKCDGCGECVEICPMGALEYKFKVPKGGKK